MPMNGDNSSQAALLREYWEMALRRKWLILGMIALSLAGAWTLCKILPKIYRSTTLIMVEHQKIPERYVQGVVSGSVQDRVNIIKQQVLSRSALTKVIEELRLRDREEEKVSTEALVSKMRKSIEVELRGRGYVQTFSISFEHRDPLVAKIVADKLASQFIEENLRVREEFVEDATEFLEEELEKARLELEAKEREISQYKAQHSGELPEQREANIAALGRMQKDLFAINETIQRISDRLVLVDKEINEYKTNAGVRREAHAGGGEGVSLASRLEELEHKLARLSAEYKDTYPDVIKTKQEIRKIESQLVSQASNEQPQDEAQPSGKPRIDPYLEQLKDQRAELRNELKYLKAREQQLRQRKANYEDRVAKAPSLEQELLILLRDYENMKGNYQSLLSKRLNARVAENLERRQKGEQFRIIDSANLPQDPYKPDQKKILLLGLLLGCGVGGGLAYILELLNPTFRRPEEIEQRLGLHVLASIPDFSWAYGGAPARRFLPWSSASAAFKGEGSGLQELRQSPSGRGSPAVPRRGRRATRLPAEKNLVSKWDPTSIVAEQYRVAAAQLSLLVAGRGHSIITVTSSIKGEGKSSTAANLAYTLAHDLAKRTVLIDCDLKCPVVHQYVSIPSSPGLVDVLDGRAEIDPCLQQPGDAPFWVLPVGDRSRRKTELPQTHLIAAIFEKLRSQFEYMILDAPPVLPLADINILSQLADFMLMVVRAGFTQEQVVERALKTMKIQTPPHVVLNAVETSTMPYYMQYGYNMEPQEAESR